MPLPTAQTAVYLSYFSKTVNVWNTIAGMDSEEFNNSAGVDVEKSLWPVFPAMKLPTAVTDMEFNLTTAVAFLHKGAFKHHFKRQANLSYRTLTFNMCNESAMGHCRSYPLPILAM